MPENLLFLNISFRCCFVCLPKFQLKMWAQYYADKGHATSPPTSLPNLSKSMSPFLMLFAWPPLLFLCWISTSLPPLYFFAYHFLQYFKFPYCKFWFWHIYLIKWFRLTLHCKIFILFSVFFSCFKILEFFWRKDLR